MRRIENKKALSAFANRKTRGGGLPRSVSVPLLGHGTRKLKIARLIYQIFWPNYQPERLVEHRERAGKW
jgi:hypothetical protein